MGPVVSGMLTQPGVASQAFSIAASQPTTQQTLAQQFNAQQLAVAGLQMVSIDALLICFCNNLREPHGSVALIFSLFIV